MKNKKVIYEIYDRRDEPFSPWRPGVSAVDLFVGIKIYRSKHNSHDCSLCSILAGDYPKNFKWEGWHDGCQCESKSILMDEESFDEQELSNLKSALLETEDKKIKAKNFVDYVPETFIDWFLEYRKSMSESDHYPYFVTENMQLIMDSYNHYKLKIDKQ